MGLSGVLKSFSFVLFTWFYLFIMLTLDIAEAKIGECIILVQELHSLDTRATSNDEAKNRNISYTERCVNYDKIVMCIHRTHSTL